MRYSFRRFCLARTWNGHSLRHIALQSEQASQPMISATDVIVISAEYFLSYLQRAFEEYFGLRVIAFKCVETAEVI